MATEERKSKRKYTFVMLFVLLLICGVAFGIAFQNDLQRPKMRHANIAEFMHEAIRMHNRLPINHYVADLNFGPAAWPNEKDLGQKKGWDKEEKECFIIYYNRDKDGVWQLNAQSLLTELVRSKQLMQEEMKIFFMNPQRFNGRKLAFYLPTTEVQYDSVLKMLTRSYADSIDNASRYNGFMYSQFGPLGFKPVGIVLRPASFDIPMNEPNSYRMVALAGLTYYESWALADQALTFIEKIPMKELVEAQASQKLKEVNAILGMAGDIGSAMSEAMTKDTTYANVSTVISQAPDSVESAVRSLPDSADAVLPTNELLEDDKE